ncbi:phosphonate metabolism protein/1,5-bisphosphokinase (PRPP-forming) PhnN [Albimonas sp. CAU 1670]|uniref:phosphonate metabolism protein/1,5-bisphosphokinase (PRPP-forming) PhnN n=1 Tax=Albimonas sp. CAU 1670 TaxID=3032599 RepID=UPI0023DBE423|nr:phosphonate metabolism protein/1,5-bisphosphokinase (PRPP-forming) PhnN [Albimonas sp. CAU 1670]MDF2232049.1 phosphonate metabolism protein/1,5-bisphosphokinase (PRPP-forming) PhnN [Albimonas sp. CAU 1670]
MRGTLHLVVGPSGVGKDTLIDAARAARPDLMFPTRVVTRPAGPGEDHEPVSAMEFARRDSLGEFALSWRAHGLSYGIPAAVETALAAGRGVVVNVSRAVVAEARNRYAPLRVLALTAAPEVRARRMAGRGRETEAEIAARLRRAPPALPEGADVHVIDNGGALAPARDAFLAALAPAPAPARSSDARLSSAGPSDAPLSRSPA